VAALRLAFRHQFADKRFDIDFSAPLPGTVALFGPSGVGKSTVVNVLAGLLRPRFALVALDGVTLADTEAGVWLPPERRGIGLVFQDSRLFPHLSVLANLRYGARRAARRGVAARIGFDDVVALLGIGALLGRRPHTLSGGERQRVAIGRALLAQPRLLALDEPLASLDADRGREILMFLARIKAELGLPMLFVSHDLAQIGRLADTLVLVADGRVAACGALAEVSARADLPIALRDDAGAILDATVAAHDPARRLTALRAAGREFLVPLHTAPVGTALRLRVPAREVLLAEGLPAAISAHNVIEGTVGAISADTSRHAALVQVRLDGAALLARVTPDAVDRLGLREGGAVTAVVKSVAIEVLG
jgi:molybdate transport system ATP-binding protein